MSDYFAMCSISFTDQDIKRKTGFRWYELRLCCFSGRLDDKRQLVGADYYNRSVARKGLVIPVRDTATPAYSITVLALLARKALTRGSADRCL